MEDKGKEILSDIKENRSAWQKANKVRMHGMKEKDGQGFPLQPLNPYHTVPNALLMLQVIPKLYNQLWTQEKH